MITGLVGACSTMAKYAGLDMDIINDGKWGIVKLCKWISISRGRALRIFVRGEAA